MKLRLMRMGKKKQPTYRVVAADSRSPRNGRFIEIVGTYEPRLEPSGIVIDNEKAVDWLRKGAQPTERVEKLLKISGAWEQFEKGTTPGAGRRPRRGSGRGRAARADDVDDASTDDEVDDDDDDVDANTIPAANAAGGARVPRQGRRRRPRRGRGRRRGGPARPGPQRARSATATWAG